MKRGWMLIAAMVAGMPAASASADDLFAEGSVTCSNYDPLSQTCKSITTITERDGDVGFSTHLRRIPLPNDQVTMETHGKFRVDGLKACGLGGTRPATVTPADSIYAEALIEVYESKRDARVARGVCAEFQPCGSGYRVYRMHDGLPEPDLSAFVTFFPKGDPRILALQPRDRVFGVPEPIKSECEPVG